MKILNQTLILLALNLVLTAPASSQQQGTDLQAEGLQGPVHIVSGHSSESTSLDGHTAPGPDKKLDSLTFNSGGRLVERVIYDDYGFLVGTEKYAHDVTGNLIGSELHDPKGVILDKQVFKFQNGTLTESASFDGQGASGTREVLTYDQSGRPQKQIYYETGLVIGKTFFKSDDRGNLIEAAFFDAAGAKGMAPIGPCYNAHRVVYLYDDKRRVTEETAYNLDGSVKRKSSYKYDDHGNVAEELRVDFASTLKFVHTYEYDRQGNWTRQVIEEYTSRLPLFGSTRDESQVHIVKQRTISYY